MQTDDVVLRLAQEAAAQLYEGLGDHDFASRVRNGEPVANPSRDVAKIAIHLAFEEAAKMAIAQASDDEHLRDLARKEKDGQGALVHASEAAAARCLASSFRSIRKDETNANG